MNHHAAKTPSEERNGDCDKGEAVPDCRGVTLWIPRSVPHWIQCATRKSVRWVSDFINHLVCARNSGNLDARSHSSLERRRLCKGNTPKSRRSLSPRRSSEIDVDTADSE